MIHVHDRRLLRSQRTDHALEFWLFHQSEVRGARAASIGTRDGLPIAAVGDMDPLFLAAVGSSVADGQAGPAELHATVVRVLGDEELVLTFYGAEAPSDAEVGRDIRRIFH